MHTDEIAEHILQEFNVQVSKVSLATQLWRHIKKHPDSPFYKSKKARIEPVTKRSSDFGTAICPIRA